MAYVHNAIGVLHRRLGEYDQALTHLTRSIVYSLFCGDVMTLQAALFNCGHCRYMQLRDIKAKGAEVDLRGVEDARRYLQLDRELRKRFNLGRDSAQTELVLARIALYQGDLQQTKAYLLEAADILKNLKNAFEAGGYHRLRGRFLLAEASTLREEQGQRRRQEGIQELRAAIRLFGIAGDRGAAKKVETELRRVEAGMDIGLQ
jgi:tetratricopeptide (TPR) repeat protein